MAKLRGSRAMGNWARPLQGDLLAMGLRGVLAQHHHHAFLEQRLGFDLTMAGGVKSDAQIQRTAHQLVLDRAGAQIPDLELHLGVALAEGGHGGRQHGIEEGGDGANGQAARLQAAQVGQGHAAGLDLLEGSRGISPEFRPRLRQLQPPPKPVEQGGIQLFLKLPQAVRQRGLGDKQVLRRLRQVFGLSDVEKVAKLPDFHARAPGQSFDEIEHLNINTSLECFEASS